MQRRINFAHYGGNIDKFGFAASHHSTVLFACQAIQQNTAKIIERQCLAIVIQKTIVSGHKKAPGQMPRRFPKTQQTLKEFTGP